jgi:hypothetical protein
VKDVDLRGIVLEKFYEVRNQEASMVNPLGLSGLALIEPNHIRLLNICEQLGEHGLLHWRSVKGMTIEGGMGKISAKGVDVVEGTAPAPIAITLHTISVSQSSNVQIGDSNIQDVSVRLETHELPRLVAELTKHLDELNLDARQKQRAEAHTRKASWTYPPEHYRGCNRQFACNGGDRSRHLAMDTPHAGKLLGAQT